MRSAFAVLAVVFVAALLARLPGLGDPALWFDETSTAGVDLSREARSCAFSHACVFLAAAGSVPAWTGETGAATRRVWRFLVPLLAALGASSHLMSSFLAAGLFAAFHLPGMRRGGALRPVLLGAAGFALLLSLQVPLVLEQIASHYRGGGGEPAPGLRDLAHYGREVLGGGWTSLLVLPPVALRRPRREVLTAAALPALIAVAAGTTAGMRRALALPAAILLLVALAAGVRDRAAFEREVREDWRAAGQVLSRRVRAGDVVSCRIPNAARPLRRYYPGPVLAPPGEDFGAMLRRTRRTVRPGASLFVVLSHAGDLEAAATEAMAVLGPATEVHLQFAIRVLRFGP